MAPTAEEMREAEEVCRKVMGFPDVTNGEISLRSSIAIALHNAGKRAREEAIEECAKVAEECGKNVWKLIAYDKIKKQLESCCRVVAEAIRKLK